MGDHTQLCSIATRSLVLYLGEEMDCRFGVVSPTIPTFLPITSIIVLGTRRFAASRAARPEERGEKKRHTHSA